MTAITPFTFPETGQPVRTVTIDGEPWWVAADVCAVLSLSNPSMATSRLQEADLSTTEVRSSGQARRMTIVSESGLYDLILDSRKPEARSFRRWITAEVIPTIRRTGSYAVAPAVPRELSNRDLARMVLEEADRADAAEQRVAELEPKAQAHDTLMVAQHGAVLVRQAAKILGWRETDLRAFLLDEHLIFQRHRPCGDREYDFYAEHRSRFSTAEKVVQHTAGPCAHYTLHITPRGLAFIQMRISRRQQRVRAAIEATPAALFPTV